MFSFQDFKCLSSKPSFPFLSTILILLLTGIPVVSQAQDSPSNNSEKAEVMILGTSHFGNPGQDVINSTFPDVLKPKYQHQIANVIDSLAQFNPTKVAIEARKSFAAEVDSMYQQYRQNNHELTRNERQQLGFRLGKRFDHSQLYAIDYKGEFPFKKVMGYAKEHNPEFMNYLKNTRQKIKSMNDSLYAVATIPEILRSKNSEHYLTAMQRNFYAQTATVGAEDSWVGVDLVTKWHRRNLKIFGHLANITEPGDQIIVIFGAGHAPLLRYFVESSRDMKLADPLDYL